jgi:hypothetical protein
MLGGRHILVVADEFLIAQELSALLKKHRATVIGPVATLRDALSLIDCTQNIDGAVLTSNCMMGMCFLLPRGWLIAVSRFCFIRDIVLQL